MPSLDPDNLQEGRAVEAVQRRPVGTRLERLLAVHPNVVVEPNERSPLVSFEPSVNRDHRGRYVPIFTSVRIPLTKVREHDDIGDPTHGIPRETRPEPPPN